MFFEYVKYGSPSTALGASTSGSRSERYPKGLWIYPETTLKYKLGAEFKTFHVVLGIDETVQIATGAVSVTIEGDGRVLFKQIVKRTDKPLDKLFDVKEVKELKITVDRESLYTGGQINFGDARLQK